MPSKSRHGRGKRSSRSKKEKSRQHFSATVAQQPAVPHPEMAAPSVTVPTPMVKLTVAQYPYVPSELRTIGILAGIIVVILVVLALVLP